MGLKINVKGTDCREWHKGITTSCTTTQSRYLAWGTILLVRHFNSGEKYE